MRGRRLGRGRQGGRRGKGDLRVAGVKVNVGVEDLAELRGGGAAAELFAEGVGGDDAGEGGNAGGEGGVGWIEADGVEAVGAAGVLRCGARQGRDGRRKQGGPGDASPYGERLGDDLFDFGETGGGGLVLRED